MNIAEINRKLTENDLLIAQLQSLDQMRSRADANAGDFDAIQSRADEALMQHGRRAKRPMLGEPLLAYRRRMANELKNCSPKWKDFPIEGVRADAFDRIEQQLYEDCALAARNPIVEPGVLRCIQKTGPGGHRINEYIGSPDAWMGPLSGSVRQYVKAFKERA